MTDPQPTEAANDSNHQPTLSFRTGPGERDTLNEAGSAPSSSVRVPGYRIEGLLGKGGMGVVYQAVQEKANRRVALKMILAGAHADQRERTRFHVEAEAVARLSHPGIVQLYEVGETPDGFPFFSLEYVAGGTLTERLKTHTLAPREAAALIEALARAMQYAHEQGIVHRDLKPANVMMTADGVPKITDFGLAKQIDTDGHITHTGAVMGTPAYMAPEQAFGLSKEVGPAADIYALGAILYECLAGRPPFLGTTLADTLDQVRTKEPLAPRTLVKDIPPDLETICLHCLHKDPQRRYVSAAALAEDLRRFQAGLAIAVRPVSQFERFGRWCRRNPGWAGMAALVAVLLLGIAGVSYGAYVEVSRQNGQIKKEQQATEAARTKADEQSKIANRRRDQALEAVGLFATDARRYFEDAMVPGESRRRLYEVLIRKLEEHATEQLDEVTLEALSNKLEMYLVLAAVNVDFNQPRKSQEWIEKGLKGVREWEQSAPDDPRARSFRGAFLYLHGRSLVQNAKPEEARGYFTDALALRRRLVNTPDLDEPTRIQWIANLADSLDSVGEFDESIRLRTELANRFEKDRERGFPYREALATTYQQAGLAATDYARRKEYLIETDRMSEQLLKERPTNRTIRLRWALSTKLFGELEYNHGKLAEKDNDQARAKQSYAEAEKHYKKLNAITQQLATSNELIDGLRDYARSFYTLGLMEKLNGQFQKARADFELCRAIRERTLRDYQSSPGSAHLQLDLMFVRIALGEIKAVLDEAENMAWIFHAEPDAEYRLACIFALCIPAIEDVRRPAPLTPADLRLQARCRAEAFRCLATAHDGGFSDFFQSTTDADFVALRDDPRMKEYEGIYHYKNGVLARKQGAAKKAHDEFEKAESLARDWLKVLPNDPRGRFVTANWLCARVQLGQHADAIPFADQYRLKLPKTGLAVFRLARVYAVAATMVNDVRVQDRYRSQAFALLQQAKDRTVSREMLLREEDLEPLRDDPRFQDLLKDYPANPR